MGKQQAKQEIVSAKALRWKQVPVFEGKKEGEGKECGSR